MSDLHSWPPEPHRWVIGGASKEWGVRPLIMGILNCTPDSFSDGGQFSKPKQALAHAQAMHRAGADIIDIGGESTRPNANPVSEDEELRRVMPVVEGLVAKRGELVAETGRAVIISIDTSKARVASEAVAAGAVIVNDVSAGRWDDELWPTIASTKAAYVLMHSSGQPHEMQKKTDYEDVVGEVAAFLAGRLASAEEAGISAERIALDPGIGFGKTPEQNAALIGHGLPIAELGRPMLVGASRKSFVRGVCGESPEEIEAGTLAAQLASTWMSGGSIWRVHDVPRAVAAAKMIEALG